MFVIRCNNTLLYDRLKARNYSEPKITANIECEIFNTIGEEAVEWFGPEAVHQLTNETDEQLTTNCQTILDWIKKFDNKWDFIKKLFSFIIFLFNTFFNYK